MARAGEVLKYRDQGLSVEDARKKMLEAGEAPSGLRGPQQTAAVVAPTLSVVATEDEGEFEPEISVTQVESSPGMTGGEVPRVASPTAAPAQIPEPAKPKVERVETDQFTGELRNENGQWVAEIRYKKGGGTERFSARSKNDLMLELLRGKANGTLRVRQAVRRERFGSPDLDKQYPLPEGTTAEDFEKMSDGQQKLILRTIAVQELTKFQDSHPEYYRTNENAGKIHDFLVNYKPMLPITLRNLEFAYHELLADDELERRPEVVAPVIPKVSPEPASAPAQTDSAPAPAVPVPAPAVAPTPVPAVTVRKRGITSLQPGMSSAPSELGNPEDGGRRRELSEAELRKLPMPELKRIADADRRRLAGSSR